MKKCILVFTLQNGKVWLDENWVIEKIYINYDLIGFYRADINAELQQFVGEVIVFE